MQWCWALSAKAVFDDIKAEDAEILIVESFTLFHIKYY